MAESMVRVKAFFCAGGMALLFCAGLLLAGSDGEWFPWPNLAGAVMLGIFAMIACRLRLTGE